MCGSETGKLDAHAQGVQAQGAQAQGAQHSPIPAQAPIPAQDAALIRLDWNALASQTRKFLDRHEIDDVLLYGTELTIKFRGITQRNGLLLHGAGGWGECAPFWDYDASESAAWLRSALESAVGSFAAAPLHTHVPVNVTIPVESPAAAAKRVRASSGCTTAKIKVADARVSHADDLARVEAVANALAELAEPGKAHVRIDANGAWEVDEAVAKLRDLDSAASAVGGLEYAEQPCWAVEDLAKVRARQSVPIAADESIRRASDPLRVAQLGAADVAVVKVAPLGGVSKALAVATDLGLDVVISSALDSSVGLAAGLRAAAALPGQTRACGLATAQLLRADVTAQPLLPSHGEIEVRSVEPDLDRVRPASTITDPGLQSVLGSWLTRLDAIVDAAMMV